MSTSNTHFFRLNFQKDAQISTCRQVSPSNDYELSQSTLTAIEAGNLLEGEVLATAKPV
ncbi:hypothetical protein [cyanobacterium endosymbiont of Rhopalodia gibberula]|uniref:hypothetical protein n=1 Tax=cyanobacterium endosymbiont of Rhopalodia gibberula TaxID=1763363 RepID=UPI001559E307|nr:hypothetical protein [cyanobacterium endosymbiont of Rhopalodia gibberula]